MEAEAEAPPCRAGRRQPRVHGSGAGGPKLHPARSAARLAPRCGALSRPPLRASGSGRYPNPIRSDTSRRETAGPPDGDSGEPPPLQLAGAGPASLREERRHHDPTSRARAPAKGMSSRAHGDSLARGRRQGSPTLVLRRTRRAAARDVSLARTHPEPRAASLTPPRRGARSAAPEVPSIGEPATTASTGPKPRLPAVRTVRPSGDRGFSTGCYQPVEKWSTPFAISTDPLLLTEQRARDRVATGRGMTSTFVP